ncbi:cell surface protein [candidate division TA06 bacterium B3_TA06]|uniref:Cell surface protein n=1 Tax=candidate division TA06 bacterium B3_TA06 TaxID=2012487 RepID=A0A532V7V2_UNCT6|nr:MAG: cell surface protein [candidate division TA06 bacterium B3_TA06]
MDKEPRILMLCVMLLLISGCKSDRPGTLKWKYKTNGSIVSSPAIGHDGTVYITSGDSCLYAFSSKGKLKWRFKTEGKIFASPSIGADGTVYISPWDPYTYAVTPEGKLKWKCKTYYSSSSPVIGQDGTVYVAAHSSHLYAITPEGELKWESSQIKGLTIMFPPAIGLDGTLYVSVDNIIYAVDTLGNLKWSFEVPGLWVRTISPLAIDKQGKVCFCTNSGGFYILTPEGEYNYCLDLLVTSEWTSAAIDSDGAVYLGGFFLHVLNPDYSRKGIYNDYIGIESVPAIGSNGIIYFGATDYKGRKVGNMRQVNYLYAVTPEGERKWRYKTGGEIKSSPAIDLDGTVYVGSLDSCVYAIRSDSKGLADSPWPKFQHDNQNTGRVGGGN